MGKNYLRMPVKALPLTAVISTAFPVFASTFTVGGSGNAFTINRTGDTSAAETVHYRAVGLSAYAGQNFTSKYGSLAFAPGQTSTNVAVSTRTPSSNAYKFQSGTTRAYRFELLDKGGFRLDGKDCTIAAGTSVPTNGTFNIKNVTIQSAEYTADDDGALQNTDKDNGLNIYTGFDNSDWDPDDHYTAAIISQNAAWFDEHDARNGVSMKLIEDFPNFYKEPVVVAQDGVVTLTAIWHPPVPDQADDTNEDAAIRENYVAWAQRYGYDALGANETAYLLDVAPWAVTNGVAPLKEGFYDALTVCNGYHLVLRIGTDLSVPKGEWLEMSWGAMLEDGRAELLCPAFVLEMYRERVARETGKPCPGLFLSVSLSPRPSSSTEFAEILEEELNGHLQ